MTEPSDSPREGRLSGDTELSALRTQLVQLIVQQGTIFSSWVKFAITVQGGLAAGLGAVLLSDLAKYRLLGLIIAFFGVATAALFAKILVRHTQWAAWYVRRGRELDRIPEIFPREGQIPEQGLLGLIIAFFAWYVRRGRELAGTPEIFPREGQIPEQVKWKDLGPVIRSTLIFLFDRDYSMGRDFRMAAQPGQ